MNMHIAHSLRYKEAEKGRDSETETERKVDKEIQVRKSATVSAKLIVIHCIPFLKRQCHEIFDFFFS